MAIRVEVDKEWGNHHLHIVPLALVMSDDGAVPNLQFWSREWGEDRGITWTINDDGLKTIVKQIRAAVGGPGRGETHFRDHTFTEEGVVNLEIDFASLGPHGPCQLSMKRTVGPDSRHLWVELSWADMSRLADNIGELVGVEQIVG